MDASIPTELRPSAPARSPVQRFSFASPDEDEIIEFMRTTYVRHHSRFGRRSLSATYETRTAEAPGITADRVRSTIDYSQVTEPFDYFCSFVVLGGTVHVESRGESAVLRPGDVVLCPIGAPVHFDMADINLGLLRLPMAVIDRVSEELTGLPAAHLTFERMLPVSTAMHRYWRSTLAMARGALLAPDPPLASDVLREETMRTVALAALHTFPNTATDPHHRGTTGEVAPAAIRRAIDFIDANADRPVTLADMAEAARTGVRALQHGFRRHHGTTPTGYLRQVRLERAHRDLQGADPAAGDTVSSIAARWGFGKASRFAAQYRDAFGVAPHQTLRT